MRYERPSKKAIGCMYVSSGIIDVIVFVAVVIGWNYIPLHPFLWARIIKDVILLFCVLDFVIFPYIRYCRYQYCITEDAIDVKEGFLFVERNIVPIERLHKIRTMRGPIDRMFGLTKMIVTTAGGDVTVRFLEEKQAEHIAESLKQRVNQIVVKQREMKDTMQEV